MTEPAGGCALRSVSTAKSACELGGGIIGGVLSHAAEPKQQSTAPRTARYTRQPQFNVITELLDLTESLLHLSITSSRKNHFPTSVSGPLGESLPL